MALLFLPACSTEDYQRAKAYGRAHDVVAVAGTEFRVYEHPELKRLAINPKGSGLMAAASGATFGAARVEPSEERYIDAARAYMAQYDAFDGCTVDHREPLGRPIYEIVLEC